MSAPSLGTWTLITPANRELGYRYLEVMYQMNRAVYASEPADEVISRMIKKSREFYHYDGPGHEIVCGFRWHRGLRQYELKSTGFVGSISPAEALDRVVEKITEFMSRHHLDRIFAVRPFVMESRGILQLYELADHHPGVAIRGSHRLQSGTYLWIKLTKAAKALQAV